MHTDNTHEKLNINTSTQGKLVLYNKSKRVLFLYPRYCFNFLCNCYYFICLFVCLFVSAGHFYREIVITGLPSNSAPKNLKGHFFLFTGSMMNEEISTEGLMKTVACFIYVSEICMQTRWW